jgi:hypothetical protein
MGEETDIGIASVGKSKKKLVDKSPIKGLRKGGRKMRVNICALGCEWYRVN